MLNKILGAGLLTLTVAVLPNHLMAQAQPAEIEARIEAVQQQAMQDPEIQAAAEELQSLIESTMIRLDPNFTEVAQRAEALQAEVAAAQEASDNARLHELAAEAQEIQQTIAPLQARALQEPAVQEKLDEYRLKLFTRMVELNPDVQEWIAQLQPQG
jgi:uncharacterized membrane-anchored protein YjiN (DUF445 family)